MSDLCAPVYVVMGSDEELTFWCFVEVMNRMVTISRSTTNVHIDKFSSETKLSSGPKWDEKATVDTAGVDQRHGPRTLSSSRWV